MFAAATIALGCAPDRVVQGRPYSLTIPSGSDPAAALPLVVFLHGYTGNGVFDDLQLVKLRDQVDGRKFIYAQPNGTPNSRGERYWNAADGCCAPAGSTVDDVGFLRALIADVQTQHPVDRSLGFPDRLRHHLGPHRGRRLAGAIRLVLGSPASTVTTVDELSRVLGVSPAEKAPDMRARVDPRAKVLIVSGYDVDLLVGGHT
jgi:hypothetical protein